MYAGRFEHYRGIRKSQHEQSGIFSLKYLDEIYCFFNILIIVYEFILFSTIITGV